MKVIKSMHLPACLASALLLPAQGPAAEGVTRQLRATVIAPVLRVADQVMIDAPETVDPGATVSVTISGSRSDGRIELWGPVTQSGKGGQLDSVADTGGSAVLTAPATPGSYELRYVISANTVLARSTLDVAAVPIRLSAPRGLNAGIDSEIEWLGPANRGDMIQVYDPVNGVVVAEVPAEGRPGAVNVAVIRGPERLGDFQIRYWSGAQQTVLRSLRVTVEAGKAWLRTPIEVFVGETFAAEWKGPATAEYAYQIVDPTTGAVLANQPAAGAAAANLKAPAKPGAYRVRFVNTVTGFVLADLPLDVDPK